MAVKKQIVYKKIDEIIPYENNPRKNEEAVKFVSNSIKEFNFQNPIIVDKDNVIIAGHTRLEAAKELGLKEVPVIVADELTPEQVKALRIADNKTGEIAGWDMDKLSLELEGIDFDMTDFGFGDFELSMLTEDFEPEEYDKDLIDEYEQKDENGNDQGLQSYNVIISCVTEEEQEWLSNLLRESNRLKRLYDCKEIINRYEEGN